MALARRRHAQDQEIFLHVLALNLMIVCWTLWRFLQSKILDFRFETIPREPVFVEKVHFSMLTNKASPEVMQASAQGRLIKQAILTGYKEQQEFLKLTFGNVFVSYFQAVVHNSGRLGVISVDHFGLVFYTKKWEYRQQKADGTLDAAVTVGWDLKQNKKI